MSTLPTESTGDKVHLGARMAISAIPWLGGPGAELFNFIIAPPLQRRRDAWLRGIEERIAELQEVGRIHGRQLADDEVFVSTVMHASRIALQNHEKEKLEALRNAVLNTALGVSPTEWQRELFLSLVDVLTIAHLQVLRAFDESDRAVRRKAPVTNAIKQIARHATTLVPALQDQPQLAEMIIDDLCRKGMLFWNEAYIARDAKQVSELGRAFLRFLSDPAGSMQARSETQA